MTIPGGERAFALHALQGEVLVIDDRGTLAFGVDATERARAAEAPASDEEEASADARSAPSSLLHP
jgi:hypothetical protein